MSLTQGSGSGSRPARRTLFTGDPMCSWCWGFAPVLREMDRAFGVQAPIRVVVGGLRAGEKRPMDDRSRDYVRHHWEQVAAATGQPFNFDFFERGGFVYDTEPACRAVVAVRNIHPAVAIDYFEAVQRAFYADNRDVTQADVLADLAAERNIPRTVFDPVFEAPEIIEATRADFEFARALGATGFPSVVLGNDDGFAFLTIGYQAFEALRPAVEAWLQR